MVGFGAWCNFITGYTYIALNTAAALLSNWAANEGVDDAWIG